MTDPVTMTIGGLVALAVSFAAEAVSKGALGEAGKDIYKALKEKMPQGAGRELATLETAPDSQKTRNALAEIIDRQAQQERNALLILTQQLIDELRNTGLAVGLEFRDLKDIGVEFEDISAKNGSVGARVERMEGGTIKAKNIRSEGRSGN